MQKKGAIEFSITTIIIVIIGVIILAIAIPWLTGTLNKAGGLTDSAFDSALRQLQGEPTRDNPIVLSQDSFTLREGEKAPLVIRYLSDGSPQILTFSTGAGGSWFKFDGTPANVPKDQTYDWRVVLDVPAGTPNGGYFARASIGDKSVPIVINVE